MSDLVLRKAVQTKLALSAAPQALAGCVRRVAERFRREQTGQDLVEYAGIVFLIALIIGALTVTNLGKTIGQDISNWITSVLNGTGTQGGGGAGGPGGSGAGA